MKKIFCFTFLLFFSFVHDSCFGNEEQNFKIYRFGDENQLGTGSDTDAGHAEDYLLIKPESAKDKPLPRKFSFCFNMFYLTMDYWNSNQKTILSIFGENDDLTSNKFFLRINNSPPRGTC